LGYSPIICKISVRLLLCTSNSKNTICCQVPRVNFPLTTGIVRLGPISEARTWECPLPSCHLFSCSYIRFLGATRSSMFGKSMRSPGSYSMVVNAPVAPGTKTVITPSFTLLSFTALDTIPVMSMMSCSP
jgi:hypothetical protein